MDDTTRYYLAEQMARLQREYAILKTALEMDTELRQIKEMLTKTQAQGIMRVIPDQGGDDEYTSNPA